MAGISHDEKRCYSNTISPIAKLRFVAFCSCVWIILSACILSWILICFDFCSFYWCPLSISSMTLYLASPHHTLPLPSPPLTSLPPLLTPLYHFPFPSRPSHPLKVGSPHSKSNHTFGTLGIMLSKLCATLPPKRSHLGAPVPGSG